MTDCREGGKKTSWKVPVCKGEAVVQSQPSAAAAGVRSKPSGEVRTPLRAKDSHVTQTPIHSSAHKVAFLFVVLPQEQVILIYHYNPPS